jgi:membrane protein implicated in regulation of membrane protease activity
LGSLIVGIVLLALNYSVNSVVMLVIGGAMVFLAVPLILVVYFSINIGAIEKLLGMLTHVYAKEKNTFLFLSRRSYLLK